MRSSRFIDRRRFCVGAAAVVVEARLYGQALVTRPNVAAIDRGRILQAADRALGRKAVPVGSVASPAVQAGVATAHDFYSGPGFEAHREALLQLSVDVPALAAGASLLRGQAAGVRYASHAAAQLEAWFVDPATRMTPSFVFAELATVKSLPNPEAVFEGTGLAEIAVAIPFLTLEGEVREGVEAWFAAYLDWLTTSRQAGLTRDRRDHHASSWMLQAAAIARLTRNEAVLNDGRHRFRTATIRAEIDGSGMFPRELASANPLRDSLMNLDLLAGCCVLLSTRFESLWEHELQDGPGMRVALARFFPYMEDRTRWPYKADVSRFHELPFRRPALLFAGRAYSKTEYAGLWVAQGALKEPEDAEMLRAFPVRQPLLWVTAAALQESRR